MPLPLFFSRRASAGSLGPTSAGTFCRGVTAFQVNKLYIQRAGGGLEFCDALLTNDAFPGNWTTGVFSAAGQARVLYFGRGVVGWDRALSLTRTASTSVCALAGSAAGGLGVSHTSC